MVAKPCPAINLRIYTQFFLIRATMSDWMKIGSCGMAEHDALQPFMGAINADSSFIVHSLIPIRTHALFNHSLMQILTGSQSDQSEYLGVLPRFFLCYSFLKLLTTFANAFAL